MCNICAYIAIIRAYLHKHVIFIHPITRDRMLIILILILAYYCYCRYYYY